MTVIVTYARVRSALAATRSLGRKGIKVITADERYPSTSFFSRYSSSYFIYPSYKSKPEQFIECLRHHIRKYNAEVLMPISEETYVVSKYKEKLDSLTKVPVPPYDKIMRVHNKRTLIEFANEIGVKNSP